MDINPTRCRFPDILTLLFGGAKWRPNHVKNVQFRAYVYSILKFINTTNVRKKKITILMRHRQKR